MVPDGQHAVFWSTLLVNDVPGSSSNVSSSCRKSNSNITTRTDGGRSRQESTDGQPETRPQSASTMVRNSTMMMTMMISSTNTSTGSSKSKSRTSLSSNSPSSSITQTADWNRLANILTIPSEDVPNEESYVAVRPIGSPHHQNYDQNVLRQRRRRRRQPPDDNTINDQNDDDNLDDLHKAFSTDKMAVSDSWSNGAGIRGPMSANLRTTRSKLRFSLCQGALRSIFFALVFLLLIMTSSAAPPPANSFLRRDDIHQPPQPPPPPLPYAHHSPPQDIPSNDAEPLSVRDGFIPYSVGNSSIAKEQSKKIFYQLNGHDITEESIGPPIIISDKPKKKNRKPGRRKPALSGRNQALQVLMDGTVDQRCEGQKFKQRVRVPGCLTKTIINRFCFGTCASYFIPRMSSKKLKAFFKSCSTCGPKEYDSVNVTLDCPGQDPPQVTQSVIKVKKCACINVDLNS